MGAALTGALGGGGNSEPEIQQSSAAPSQQSVTGGGRGPVDHDSSAAVCQFELRQFIECSQTQHDLSLCQGFNEALRECRRANGTKPSILGSLFVLFLLARNSIYAIVRYVSYTTVYCGIHERSRECYPQ